MPIYLFDMILRGIIDADNEDQARACLTALADEDGHAYIDEYADLVLMKMKNPAESTKADPISD